MIKNPLVSIIVPIYNAEKYMKKGIDSIINQTLKEIEIILINDGSSDNSGKIADEYAKKDSRIIVIHQENSGPSVARNKGISIAKGKYIGFVDSDDYVEETMYEEMYKYASENKVQMAMCSYYEKSIHNNKSIIVNTNLQPYKVYNKLEIKENIISTFAKNENYGFYSLWNKIYERGWLQKTNIQLDINREHGEDWWFNINIFNKLQSYIYISKPLYNYIHINKNSLMFKYRENQFDLVLDGRLKMKEIIPTQYINQKEFNQRFVYEFSSYIVMTIKKVQDRKKKKQLIDNVLNNSEVIDSCKNVSNLPIHFKIISFFIKNKIKTPTLIIYKVISLKNKK